MKDARAKITICFFLIVTTFCVYAQIKNHEFTNIDDSIHCCLRIYLAGLTTENIKWAFATFSTGNWFPVTFFSHILDFQLYGLHPKGHHLTNLFFHIANTLVLFIVLSRMTRKLWQSAFVAAVFAFHPLNVESVAWAAERKNVLSTFFWLLTMWAYIHYSEKLTAKKYGLVLFFFSLGLMSKSMVVTLPFVLLLLDYWPLKRLKFTNEIGNREVLEKNNPRKVEVFQLILEKIPLFLLATVVSIVTFIAQESFGTMNYTKNFTFSTRATNAMVSYIEYLKKMIWPEKLTIFYPHPENTLPIWQGILCSIALVGITIISIRLIRKAPYFAVGWFWYMGTLLPVIGFVGYGMENGAQSMADRYAYIPLIGIFIIVAWGIPESISRWRYRKKVLSFSSGIIILTLMITTWKQVGYWKNSFTVFDHAVRVTDKKYPSASIIHNHLGMAFYEQGKSEEAISYYKMATQINPTNAMAYYNLGIALFAKRKNEEAISNYKMAIRINPEFAKAHYNLGVILLHKRKVKEAVQHFREAIRLAPNLIAARNYLEFIKLRLKEFE